MADERREALVRVLVTSLLASPVITDHHNHIGHHNHTGHHKEPSLEYVCQLPAFCSFATQLQSQATAALQVDVGVLTSRQWNVSRECPGTFAIVPDAEFFDITERMYSDDNKQYSDQCHLCDRKTARILVIKWFAVRLLQYNLIVLLDLDIDFMSQNVTSWIRPLLTFHASDAQIAGPSDWAVPINTGSIVFKPNMTTYQRGLSLLQTGLFNTTHGLGHVGPPRTLRNDTFVGRFTINRFYRSNTWSVASGSSDQGLFSLLYHTWACSGGVAGRYIPKAHGLPAYTVAVKHFWASAKPMYKRGCKRWVANLSIPADSVCNATISKWLHMAGHQCSHKKLYIM